MLQGNPEEYGIYDLKGNNIKYEGEIVKGNFEGVGTRQRPGHRAVSAGL